jgi:hypothetical protein
VTSPCAAVVSTSAWTDSREETSTVAVPTSKSGVRHHLGRCIGVRLVEVGEHDMLAGADPTGNRLADQPCSDDDGDFANECLLSEGVVRRNYLGRYPLCRVAFPERWPKSVPLVRG